jgi:ferredoxin
MSAWIRIANSSERFECAPGQNVLQGMLQRGRKGIPVGCRGGGCGICKVRVIDGRFSTGVMSTSCVSDEERRAGFALACKLFPETDLEVDVVGKISRIFGQVS